MRAAVFLLALLLVAGCRRHRQVYDFVETRDHDRALTNAELMIAEFADKDDFYRVMGYGRPFEDDLPTSFVDAFPMCHAFVSRDHVVVSSWKAMRTFTLYYFAVDANIQEILAEPLSDERVENHLELQERVWCIYEDGSLD